MTWRAVAVENPDLGQVQQAPTQCHEGCLVSYEPGWLKILGNQQDPSDEELFGVPRSVVIGGAVLGLVALVAGGVFAVPSLRQAVLRRVSRRQRNKIDVERNLLAPVTIQAINQRLRNEQHHQRDREGATADIGNKPQVVALGDVVRVLPPAVAPRPDHSLASQEDAIYIQPANVYENLRPGAAPPSPPPPPPPQQQQQHRTRNTIYANLRAQFLSSSSSLSPTEATSNTRQSQQRPPLRPKPNKAAINNKTRSSSGGGHVNVGADLRDDASAAAAGATAAAVSASAGTSRRASKPSGSAIYAAVKKFEGR
ncbi:unnamed protein product [Notodromas monacha]|uniref:Uncharacterized protein n=1 Tax=Notodromas monacha TaxID=399045 RepID=A0A7R9BVB4_9CRUS|nr:unnamed protein product [Notodromas monacha]CAG0922405.1 unnamed protein product [Notodromas monacha]